MFSQKAAIYMNLIGLKILHCLKRKMENSKRFKAVNLIQMLKKKILMKFSLRSLLSLPVIMEEED